MASGDVFPKAFPLYASLDGGYRELINAMHDKRRRCEKIAKRAKSRGLDVTADKVSRHYREWCNWDEGRLATGYIIRITGVRRIKE